MNARDRTKAFVQNWLRPTLVGLCVGVLCCTLIFLLAALLIRSVNIPRGIIKPLAVTAAGIGAFAAGLTAALLSKRRGLAIGALCGLWLFLIILLTGCVRTGSVNGTYTLIKGAVLIAAGAVGGVLGVNGRRQ